MSEWISVEERLPEQIGPILACYTEFNRCESPIRVVGWVFFTSSKQFAIPSGGYAKEVTHWMPLPEPPKEG
jgi:hypothetical protein